MIPTKPKYQARQISAQGAETITSDSLKGLKRECLIRGWKKVWLTIHEPDGIIHESTYHPRGRARKLFVQKP